MDLVFLSFLNLRMWDARYSAMVLSKYQASALPMSKSYRDKYWGWTFVIVHDAIAVYGVMPFLAVRFAIAAVAAGILWGRHLDRRSLKVGAGIGTVGP